MKVYRGDRTIDGVQVTVDGKPLKERVDLKQISKNGFEWSYEGPEPAQLALAILADCAGDATALKHYDTFMQEVVANFQNDWEMTEADVMSALEPE
ncbi:MULTISPECIES: DUF6166 domain-containing protein [Limibacillus]|jgi:hypothetical protein|uniref:Uncharacterized protein n=1 Tax=Limibacillus halophilus TaxID=1579333 RepID=A0A839STI6_9PROT|nr:DUF6166 domain-containing protein [Limibacillus halophilus]MBB3064223.1 hypothetical protein [Limibacillus halophilus]